MMPDPESDGRLVGPTVFKTVVAPQGARQVRFLPSPLFADSQILGLTGSEVMLGAQRPMPAGLEA